MNHQVQTLASLIYIEEMSQVLRQSQLMLELMLKGDWLAAQQVDGKRQSLLNKPIALPDPDDQGVIEKAHQLVSEIYKCNQQMVKLGESQLDSYTSAKQALDKRRRAVLAYSG